jgi:hypothetical protein
MPRGDGTGPMEQGAMTGRGLGTCSRKRRFWQNLGWKKTPYSMNAYPINLHSDDEKKYLDEKIKALEVELNNLKKNLSELEKEER